MKSYLNLKLHGPGRLEILRAAAARTGKANWRDARTLTFHSVADYGLSRGLNNDGRDVVYVTSDANYFRHTKFADECKDAPRSLQRHKGWFTDSTFQEETMRGAVARLPHGFYIAGYYESCSGQYVWYPASYADQDDAASAADWHAESMAEKEREYQDLWQEARDVEQKIEDKLTRLRELILLRHARCMEYVRDEAREAIEKIRELRDTLAESRFNDVRE